jgi:hypothetical protein
MSNLANSGGLERHSYEHLLKWLVELVKYFL